MDADTSWKRYFFLGQSQRTLEEWARALHLFRFVRHRGGHSIDGDKFLALARYDGEADLEAFLATLGVRLNRMPKDARDPVPGQPYSHEEWARFPSRIPGLEHLEQPKHQTIAGGNVFIWVQRSGVTLHVGAPRYEVTDDDVAHARRIEELLAPERARFIDPPQDDRYCVCPKFYPEFFG